MTEQTKRKRGRPRGVNTAAFNHRISPDAIEHFRKLSEINLESSDAKILEHIILSTDAGDIPTNPDGLMLARNS